MRRPVTNILLAALLGGALLVGCGSDDDTATTTTSDTTTTIAPPESSTTTTTAAPLPDEPPLSDTAVSGSGCAPGAGPLPDGWWYGTVDGPPDPDLAFDLACYYLGDAAEAEAAQRGDEVNNDYYVVNENPAVRDVSVAPGASARCVELGSGVQSVDCDPSEVAGDWAVWLRVQGGTVDLIVEQYAP